MKLARLAVVLAVLPTVGCTGLARMKAERDALFTENQALREDLRLMEDELSASRSAPVLDAPAPVITLGDSGFEGIADVEVATNAAGELALRLPSDVLFPAGKADLKSAAKTSLQQVASVINSDYAGSTIRVEGYTDTDPIRKSGWKDNLELSLERAAAVHRYLVGRGIPAERLYAAGYGSENPLQSKAASRRVEIVVVR